MVCKGVLNWSLATETIKQMVLNMGRDAAPFIQRLKAPLPLKDSDVIEINEKFLLTATAAAIPARVTSARDLFCAI